MLYLLVYASIGYVSGPLHDVCGETVETMMNDDELAYIPRDNHVVVLEIVVLGFDIDNAHKA